MLVFRSHLVSTLLAAALVSSPVVLCAQQTQQPQQPSEIAPRSADGQTPTQTNFNKDQILTATVHQAWLLSGKNEANFYAIVEQLAEISAQNRGITLPNDEAAGRRMGEYIKQMAKADTDQLLYAVVDKALVMVANAPTRPVSSDNTVPKS